MTFSEFLQISEQGTTSISPLGGPSASGRLGESPVKPAKVTPPSQMSPRGLGTKQPDPPPKPVPGGPMLPGTKRPAVSPVKGPLEGGAFGGGSGGKKIGNK